jgi:hypothetical protein
MIGFDRSILPDSDLEAIVSYLHVKWPGRLEPWLENDRHRACGARYFLQALPIDQRPWIGL